ncbi:hypothetical protein J5X84_34120 [Streptosporangiaceae bacterium NEAU-GS5]|nr:hypothetical protein [Streptosporangiaceae bacterium NEAU-GS5]
MRNIEHRESLGGAVRVGTRQPQILQLVGIELVAANIHGEQAVSRANGTADASPSGLTAGTSFGGDPFIERCDDFFTPAHRHTISRAVRLSLDNRIPEFLHRPDDQM